MAQTPTVINWLIEQILSDQLIKSISQKEWLEIFRRAKEMEKNQIIKAFDEGDSNWLNDWLIGSGEDYFNETFNP